MNDYSKIIEHPHYRSKKRKPMSMMQRAAQFSPFAALSGYDEAVHETTRATESKRLLDDDARNDIDRTLRFALLSHKPVSITYYVPDLSKPGGSYITFTGCIHQVDMSEDVVIMNDGSAILMYNITDISLQE
jgi:hypothetical protein